MFLQGQLLGIGGKQLQRIKQESSARVEVVNAQGNLNGSHPDPLDPDLHALIQADSVVGRDQAPVPKLLRKKLVLRIACSFQQDDASAAYVKAYHALCDLACELAHHAVSV